MVRIISIIGRLFPESYLNSSQTFSKLKMNVAVLSHSKYISSPPFISVMIFGNLQSPANTCLLEVPRLTLSCVL